MMPPGTPGLGYGYSPHGASTPPQRLAGLATALSILLGVATLASLAVATSLANRAAILGDGPPWGPDELGDADDAVAGTTALYLLVLLTTGVVWLVWQYRHARNADSLGQRGGLGAGWAIGGWFVPLANLVLGPLQLSHAARATSGRTPPILYVWWALWLLQPVVGLLSGRLGFGDDEADGTGIDEFRRSDILGSVGGALAAAAAIAAIITVRILTRRQQAAFEARADAST